MTILSIDVVGTMGYVVGDPAHTLADIARQYNPNPPHVSSTENPWHVKAAEINRWYLNVQPQLNHETIEAAAGYLMFPASAWPHDTKSQFHAFGFAEDALRKLRAIGKLVALTNLSILGGPSIVHDINEQLGHLLRGVYTSYELGTRKPHRRGWQTIAADHHVTVGDIIHIGDTIPEDIHGPLNAGCRGAILVGQHGRTVPPALAEDPRVAVVEDLRAAASVAAVWATRQTVQSSTFTRGR